MEIFGIIFVAIIVGIIDVSIISLICVGCETAKGKIIGSIIVLLSTMLIVGCSALCAIENEKVWKDGYCECGGKWKLVAVSDTDHSSRTKYYICDECYKEITQ